jgi:hypothetical protein
MMPAPQAQVLSQLTKALFQAKMISVPEKWDGSLEDKFNMKLPEFQPGTPRPTNIFTPPSINKIAVDACNSVSEQFERFIDDVSSAICTGWESWQGTATFAGVIINAGVGILSPGGLIGGPQMSGPLVLADVEGTTKPGYLQHAQAVVSAIGEAWMEWATGYSNPALPFPGGMVASATMVPSPNVPMPIATGASAGDALLQPAPLKASMLTQYGPPGQHTDALFDAFSQAFCQVFQVWKGTSMISNVVGSGGVAPPPPSPPGPVAGAIGAGGAIV